MRHTSPSAALGVCGSGGSSNASTSSRSVPQPPLPPPPLRPSPLLAPGALLRSNSRLPARFWLLSGQPRGVFQLDACARLGRAGAHPWMVWAPVQRPALAGSDGTKLSGLRAGVCRQRAVLGLVQVPLLHPGTIHRRSRRQAWRTGSTWRRKPLGRERGRRALTLRRPSAGGRAAAP